MTDTDTLTRRQRFNMWFGRQWHRNTWPKVTLAVIVSLMFGIGYGRLSAPKPDFELALSTLELPAPPAPDLSGVAKSSDLSEIAKSSEVTGLAKTTEVTALAGTLGELRAEIKLLAEKPTPSATDISGLATAEALAALKTSVADIKPSVDTSALEKAVADLGTKVGETPTTVISEIKALREEIAKIPTSVQTDNGALVAMTTARDEVVTQLRASEAKLAAAESKATAMEQYADGLITWANDNIGQLGYKFQQGQDGAWGLVPTQ